MRFYAIIGFVDYRGMGSRGSACPVVRALYGAAKDGAPLPDKGR